MVRRAASECTAEQRAGNRSSVSREAGAWANCSDLRTLFHHPETDMDSGLHPKQKNPLPWGRVECWGDI